MILPPRVKPARPRGGSHAALPAEPSLRQILLGTGAFVLIAAAGLYLVAQLAL